MKRATSLRAYACLIVLLISCVMVYGKNDYKYTFELTIEPSFLASKTWTIQRGMNECVFNGMKYPLSKKDALLNSYLSQLDSLLSVFKFNKYTSVVSKEGGITVVGLDGVSTRGRLILPDKVKTFSFHTATVDKDATQEELIHAFYNIAFYFYFQSELKNQLTAAEKEYLEKLENAGVGRNPIRLVSSNPLTYRLFDRVYTFSYKPVLKLLNGLDKRVPVIIEVGRYYDINQYDEFVSPFKEFLKTRTNIYWIASGKAREALIAMGLDKKYIFSDKTQLPKMP